MDPADRHRFPGGKILLVQGNITGEVPVDGDLLPSDGSDQVSPLHPGFLRRIAFRQILRIRGVISRAGHDNHRAQEGKQKIEKRPRCHDQQPLPDLRPAEGPFRHIPVILSPHGAGTSERQNFQGISCPAFPAYMAQKPRPHPERELNYKHAIQSRQQKMPEFMK